MSLDLLNNPVVQILLTLCIIVVFILFCRVAKKVSLPASLKKIVMVLTLVAAVVFNVLYSKGNAVITASGDYSTATMALVGSLIWVFIFAFVLMAQTSKPTDDKE